MWRFAGGINGEEVSMNMVSYIGNIVALSDGSMNDSSDEDVSWAENYGGLFGGQYGGKLYLNNAYDISNIAVDSLTKTLPVVGGVLGKVNIPSKVMNCMQTRCIVSQNLLYQELNIFKCMNLHQVEMRI